MSEKKLGMLIDLSLCVGCNACAVACKQENEVPTGCFNTWIESFDVETDGQIRRANIPKLCNHCEDAPCVKVCPTEASHIAEDGTVQIDKSKCIGCQFCAMACPYGVRYLNEEERVVEKCTLCEQKVAQGELPQCVAQCGARARFFGDLDKGVDNFEGPAHPDSPGCQYDEMTKTRVKLKDYVEAYTESDIHHLKDAGNKPKLMYLLREGRKWRE